MKLLLAAALLLATASASAQTDVLELLRQDIKTQKVALLTASLPLTEKEADAFWPIYRDYDNELSKLGDRRFAVIKEVFAKYKTMDNETAERLVKESLSIAEDRTGLLKKYHKKVSKALGAVTAARFLQVESQMLTLLDAQIVDQVPLVKTKPAAEEKK